VVWKVHVHEHECGLLFRKGHEVRWLPPGTHRIWRPWRARVEKLNRLETRLEHPRLDELLRCAELRAHLQVVELAETQRALVWVGERLACVVGPGRHAFWVVPRPLRVEVRDASEIVLKHPRLDAVVRHADRCTLFSVVNVGEDEQLLLSRNGAAFETLGPGAHVLWQTPEPIRWKIVERRAQLPEAAVQPAEAPGAPASRVSS
jgi:hypothetical protein